MTSVAQTSKSSPSVSSVSLFPTADGCCVRVTGRGTSRESSGALAVALRTLEGDEASVVTFDMTSCDYLDSTFLGCLTSLFQHFGRSRPPRFLVAAPPDRRKKLFGACRLDVLLPFAEAAPVTAGNVIPIPTCDDTDPRDVAEHVMACHKALASVDSPMRPAFERIANQLEKELAALPSPPYSGERAG